MTKPKDPDRYPVAFGEALDLAYLKGEFRIPAKTSTPSQLRAQFYGFLEALRKSGRKEQANGVILRITPEELIISLKEGESTTQDIAEAVKAAKGGNPFDPSQSKFFKG